MHNVAIVDGAGARGIQEQRRVRRNRPGDIRRAGARGGRLQVRVHPPSDDDDRGPHGLVGHDDRGDLLPRRLRPIGRSARRLGRRAAMRRSSSSTGPSSTRAAAGSRRIEGCSFGRPTAGPGRSGRRRRTAARSSTSWSADGEAPAGRRPADRRPRLGAPARADAHAHGAARAVRRRVARLRRARDRRQHGAGQRAGWTSSSSGCPASSSTRSRRRSTTSSAAGRDVRVNVLPRDEAFAIPDLIRTKINLLPPGIEEIRTIEIVGLDLQADGGTHVANTSRGRRHPGHRLRVEGPDQQAHPDRARRSLSRFRHADSGLARAPNMQSCADSWPPSRSCWFSCWASR